MFYQTQKESMVGVRYLLWRWTVQSVAAIPTVLRSMMTVAFCLYDFRIISLKIAKNKDLYYDALGQAQIGWHEGTEDTVPFIKYLLGTVLAAYKDFEDRFALVETKEHLLLQIKVIPSNKC